MAKSHFNRNKSFQSHKKDLAWQAAEKLKMDFDEACHSYRTSGFDIGVRMAMDAAILALNEAFQFGEKRQEAFDKAFRISINEIAKAYTEDVDDNHDKTLTYSTDNLDERLHQIVPSLPSFNERFSYAFLDSKGIWEKIRPRFEIREGNYFAKKQ